MKVNATIIDVHLQRPVLQVVVKVLTNGYISPAEPWLVLIMMALDHPHLI